VIIGAEPRTQWLPDLIHVDDGGFILTDRDVPQDVWPLPRPPLPFETSLPGVFAAGDVRYGSVKRVAGAVGEGSVAVGSVQQYLTKRELAGKTWPGVETITPVPSTPAAAKAASRRT
jgi:thioredoxin reductase (NADPH)